MSKRQDTRVARAVAVQRAEWERRKKYSDGGKAIRPIEAAIVYENLVFIMDAASFALERENLVSFGEGLKKALRLAEEAAPLALKLVPADCVEDCKKDIAQERKRIAVRRRLLGGE